MSGQRDTLILLGLFVALVAFIALGPARSASVPGSGPSSYASGPGGALALYRWLLSMGYDVGRLQGAAFAPEPAAHLLIVLGPADRYDPGEAEAVARWVAEGGTLLLAEEHPGNFAGTAPLLEVFELAVAATPEENAPITVAPVLQPALGTPPLQALEATTRAVIRSERDDVAPLAGAEDAPVVVGLQHGEGYVFASSTLQPFTNAGIGAGQNPALMLNILRRIPAGGRVVFDEYHHGFVGQATMRELLLRTPWGWATLYGATVLAVYLIMTGRRFGRAVPLRAETDRRSSAEYLESMAGLLRRAGRRDDILAQYRAALKRRLARAHGLSPQLDDEAFVAALAVAHPAGAPAVADLLARMARPASDDRAALRLVAEADALMERL